MQNIIIIRQVFFNIITVKQRRNILACHSVLVFITLQTESHKKQYVCITFAHIAKIHNYQKQKPLTLQKLILLIVNTATRCGFTPQYKDLEAIYEKYNEQGFEILDFPCNQFGGQAPGTIAEIKEFCSTNYNVKFTQFDKIEVNGENEHPLYTYLKANAENKNNIRWNFTKFLISADGKILKRFESGDKMEDVESAVAQALNSLL